LVLDHLTIVDTDPLQLIRTASDTGFGAVGLFLHALEVLPLMPMFDLVADRRLRREVVGLLADTGQTVDLAYPFTLTGRTRVTDLAPAMECAAALGARAVNVLIYDGDRSRRTDSLAQAVALAASLGLSVALEFFPGSRIPSLPEALEQVAAVAASGPVGVNVDLLHLVRSGGRVEEVAGAPAGAITFAQMCDGLLAAPPDAAIEASSGRMLPGSGQFDVSGFLAALPPQCPVSVEVPRDRLVSKGVPPVARAQQAWDAAGPFLQVQ
jgi:sugar phosphate isomerase/epimerase